MYSLSQNMELHRREHRYLLETQSVIFPNVTIWTVNEGYVYRHPLWVQHKLTADDETLLLFKNNESNDWLECPGYIHHKEW